LGKHVEDVNEFGIIRSRLGNKYIARVESYVTATHVLRPEAGGFRFVVAGRYVDRFERRGDEWRIAARKLVVDWLDVPEEASAIRAHLAQITERGRSSPDDFWYQQ